MKRSLVPTTYIDLAGVRLDEETRSEIAAYSYGMHMDPVFYRLAMIPADEREMLEFWLKTKTDFEGPPIKGLVMEIGMGGSIDRPVILDVDHDIAAEGRHRLAAALEFGLDVPAVLISARSARGWKKCQP